VSVSGFWPDVVSLGLGVLAVALGAWYSVDKWAERARRYQAVKWDGPSGFEDVVADLISPHTFEAEERTGAEEIPDRVAWPCGRPTRRRNGGSRVGDLSGHRRP
jgi:hypothetical protein